MPPRRRQRRRENRNVPQTADPLPPLEIASAAPSEGGLVEMVLPEGVPPEVKVFVFSPKKQRRLPTAEQVLEFFVERLVDLAFLLVKLFKLLGGAIWFINMVTYPMLIVSSQVWLSMSILEILVFLLLVSKMQLQFPLKHFAKFLIMIKDYLASHFRILVLSCVCIAFVEDCLGKKPPVQRLKILWNLLFAQFIMYFCTPFMKNFADIMNVVLAGVSMVAIMVEAVSCRNEEMVRASMNFLPYALIYHSLFISILGTYLTYYEADKILDRYMGS